MSDAEPATTAEHRRWNDQYWISVWLRREQLTESVTPVLLRHARPVDGDRLLDVGSGGGGTTIAVGRLVGCGAAVGADISVPLVELARGRAAERGVTNVSFEIANLQHDAVAGGPFDAAISQFGVMFFDQPVDAFTNIRRQLRPGGRLAFACWQPVARNPWHAGPVLARFIPPPAPPGPGRSPTGPFTLGDPERVREILGSAGWTAIECTPYESVRTVDADALVDDGQLRFLGVPADSMDEARQAVDDYLAPLRDAAGRIEAPLAYQIVTATA